MKKLFTAVLSLTLLGAAAVPASASNVQPVDAEPPAVIAPAPEEELQPGYTLKIDGEATGVRACIMVPLKAVAEKLGFTVTWKGGNTIFMDDGTMHTTVTIGEDLYQVTTSNPDLAGMSAPFSLGVPPCVANGVTYVPLGLFDALLGSQEGAVTMEDNVISLDTDPLNKGGSVQIPNPFSEYGTLAEAARAAGFELAVPDALNGSDQRVFRAIENDLLEVIYHKGENEAARVRKAIGTGDVSGDYNVYAQVSEQNGITMKGENGMVMTAIWENGGYAYSVTIEGGMSAAAVAGLIQTIK